MQSKHLMIKGHVQGVFFRATMQEQANLLNVCGWVRNTDDGSVEAHLEGEDYAIHQIIEWSRVGPPNANVESIEISDCQAENCTSFTVLR